MDANESKYLYADILIAMAYADGKVEDKQREMIDGIFQKMDLDSEKTEKMWFTPRTPDIIEEILKDVTDENFKRCLLKDCYLLAYADEQIVPEESALLKSIQDVANLAPETVEKIHEWVKTAIEQQKEADLLFG